MGLSGRWSKHVCVRDEKGSFGKWMVRRPLAQSISDTIFKKFSESGIKAENIVYESWDDLINSYGI